MLEIPRGARSIGADRVAHPSIRTLNRAIAAVAVSVAVCALVLAAPIAASAASTISGAVRNGDTNAVITIAEVDMLLEHWSGGAYLAAASQVTNSGGYSFAGLEAGQYRLRQVGNSPYGYFPPEPNPGAPIIVDGLTDVTSDWLLYRSGFGAGTSVVSGEIRDQVYGNLIVGPTIWVALDQKMSNGTWAHIGDSYTSYGSYSFEQLGVGEYRVRFVGAPPAAYRRLVPDTSPGFMLDGTNSASHDWLLTYAAASVPASSAWSLALAMAAGLAIMAVRARAA